VLSAECTLLQSFPITANKPRDEYSRTLYKYSHQESLVVAVMNIPGFVQTNTVNNNNNKYSFFKTFDKPQINTTATTGISDAGAAPVGHQLQRLSIGCQPTSTAPVAHYVPAKAGTNLYCLVDRGTYM